MRLMSAAARRFDPGPWRTCRHMPVLLQTRRHGLIAASLLLT